MASDFSKPLVTDGYAALLPALVTEMQDIVRGLEPTATGTHTNVPTNAIRWNQTSSKWERYNGTSWGSLPTTTDTYGINITGTAANIAGAGIVAVANGGTGIGTLTGVVYGNGTAAHSAATAAQIVSVIGATAVANATNATTAAACSGNAVTATTAAACSGNAATATTAAACSGNAATATSATTTTNFAGGAAGYLPYQSGAGVTALLAAGLAGQSLIANGAAAPSWGSGVISGTTVATTSGTSIDFTGIPSWAKRITVMLNGVSTNGTSFIQFQLGSGSPQTTGYAVGCFRFGAASGNGQSFSTGFGLNIATATDTYGGTITFNTLGSNIWTGQATIGSNGSTFSFIAAGAVTLGGVLDRVRITTVNGTDTFDAGSVNIIWE